jgi:hypothetical protein
MSVTFTYMVKLSEVLEVLNSLTCLLTSKRCSDKALLKATISGGVK